MHKTALICGAVLVALGLIGYFGVPAAAPPPLDPADPAADVEAVRASRTALVPALAGILFMIAGTLGLEPRWRKHAMHGAAAVAAITVLAAIGGLVRPALQLAAGEPINPRAVAFIVAMGVVAALFLGLAIRSFIAARKQQSEAQASGPAA